MRSEAYFSPDRKHRYWLLRVWDESKPLCCFIGVNPSVADETTDDHTITKEMHFAREWGYGGLLKLNVGAYRSTDPRKWKKAWDPIGPENDIDNLKQYIQKFQPAKIVAAWGANGSHYAGRCADIVRELQPLWCFGTNKDGTPVHTLRLPYSSQLQPYTK